MKTTQVMVRHIGEFVVSQKTKGEMFNATELLSQWNKKNPDKKRDLDNFWKVTNLTEFMSEVAENELGFKSADFTELKKSLSKTTRGKYNGGTWMNKVLFMKFAMWLNPRFEYQVIKFMSDKMLLYRDLVGEGYKNLAKAVSEVVPKRNMPYYMQHIAKGINYIIAGDHKRMMRNELGEEEKQIEYERLQSHIIMSIESGLLSDGESILIHLRGMYLKRKVGF